MFFSTSLDMSPAASIKSWFPIESVAQFLLRDGKKVRVDVNPDFLEVFTYQDNKSQTVYALLSSRSERDLLKRVPSTLVPLTVRMNQALSKVGS